MTAAAHDAPSDTAAHMASPAIRTSAEGHTDTAPSCRILYLVSLFPCWSETFIVREIHALQRQGADIRIVSLKPHSEPMVQPDAQCLLDQVIYPPASLTRRLAVALPQILLHPCQSAAELWPLLRSLWRKPAELAKSMISWWRTLAVLPEVRHFAPDHIHAHWATYPSTAARILAGRLGCPWSFTGHAHDIFIHDHDLGAKLQQAAFSVTISEFNRRRLASHLSAQQQDQLSVIHCGVLPADIPFVTQGRSDHDLVGVGRLDPIKGFIHLIQACQRLSQQGIRFHCDIIGEGPLRDELTQAIDQAGLTGQVVLTGALPQQEVRQRISQATLFVLPSVQLSDGNADGIPVALMEAMASGATVISTRVSGIPELVQHDSNGVLVEPGQADELASAIAGLLNDAPRRARLALAARATILKDFDVDIEAAKLLTRIQHAHLRGTSGQPAMPTPPMSSAMRVMLMTDEMEVGGSQRQIVQLAMGLKSRGIECTVLYYIRPSFLVDRLHEAGIPTIRVNKRRRIDIRFVAELRKAIGHWSPDILHCYSFTAELWGAVVIQSLPPSRRPALITSIRGTYEWYSKQQWNMKRWVSRHSQAIISNSREGAEYAARHMDWPIGRFSVVHNGVDIVAPDPGDVAAMRQHYLSPARFDTLLLFVGRLVEHKNLPRLLEAFAQVARQRPGTRLLLAGSGPLQDDLLARIKELALRDQVLLLGERNDVPTLMAAADLLVAPSLREGMSNVILEALGLGLPVLATRVGGTPEVIEHGQDGMLIEPTDTQALAHAMLQLIDDPTMRRTLGQAGREKVLKQYSPPAMVSAMLKEYSRVSKR
ncbi:MAG: glycosyltransferase [Lautropia sp.]|nr:glycosyltransferase [Lautropia sp.]